MIVLVSGSRYGKGYHQALIEDELRTLYPKPKTKGIQIRIGCPIRYVIHGRARGIDTLADEVASAMGIPIIAMPANWEGHGPSAGSIRNKEMIHVAKCLQEEDERIILIAFPASDSSGTKHMIRECKKAGFEVNVFTIN